MTPDAEGFTFVVLGRAAPQGSKDLQHGKDGKAHMVESSKAVGPWRKKIMLAAMGTDGRPLATFTGPIEIDIEFEFRQAKSNDDDFPTVQHIGDGDKLTRAVWDALTQAGVIEDDAFCVRWSGSKHYAEEDRAYITVRAARPPHMRPVGPAIIDRMSEVVDAPMPHPRSIVDFAEAIGVTLDPWQVFVADEVLTHSDAELKAVFEMNPGSPTCCNTVDHKSCLMFGASNCPCPDHCTA